MLGGWPPNSPAAASETKGSRHPNKGWRGRKGGRRPVSAAGLALCEASSGASLRPHSLARAAASLLHFIETGRGPGGDWRVQAA